MAILDVVQKLIPDFINISGDTVVIDEASSSFGYVGIAPHGSLKSESKWKILRVYRQGTVYTIETAPNTGYTNIWDNRVSLFTGLVLNNAYSVEFDGVNDYIDFGNNYGFEHTQAFSVSFWCKPNNLSAQRGLISKCTNDASVAGWNIQHQATTGNILVQMRNTLGVGIVYTGTATSAIASGVWQHIVVTFNGNSNANGIRVYKNTAVDATAGSAAMTGTWVNGSNLVVGARGTSFPYSGFIDEVSIWDKALSQAEITELYNSGQPGELDEHSALANLQSWWRMGDNDTFPTILDQINSINGTMTNMTADDIVGDIP